MDADGEVIDPRSARWLRVATWIGIDREMLADEDGALDPELGRKLQGALASVEGVDYVDGMALFDETEEETAPIKGGRHAG